jgi:phytoene dehydrogenase-like protein
VARRRGRGVAGLLRLSRLSAADVLRRYFTDEALLAPVSLTGPAVWGLAPQTPGTGLGALGYALRHLAPTGRPVGGSGALTDAVASALRAAGGEVRTGARVAVIRTRGGRTAGVTLGDGTVLDAPVVVAAADPRSVLVDLLDGGSPAARRLAARWRRRPGRDGYESKLDAVVDTLPRFAALDDAHLARLGVTEPLGPTAVVAPTLAGIAAARAEADAGRVAARPLFMTNVPSVPDPSVRLADGGHVFSLEVLFTPYTLAGGWAASREPERWLEAYATLVQPGWLDGVRRLRTVGPEDYERDFAMPAGYAPSFAGGPLAALAGRDRELTRYATRVPGLYLTGAGTFPGAGVSGAPGRNAAAAVLGRELRRGWRGAGGRAGGSDGSGVTRAA